MASIKSVRRLSEIKNPNHLRAINSSTNQDYNMIDGLLNNGPSLPPQPPEKEREKVKKPPNMHKSRKREER